MNRTRDDRIKGIYRKGRTGKHSCGLQLIVWSLAGAAFLLLPGRMGGGGPGAASSGVFMTVFADDLIPADEDEILFEIPDIEDPALGLPEGEGNAGEQAKPADDKPVDDDVPLIEAGGDSSSSAEGMDLDTVLAAEQAAEKARKRIEELTGKDIPVLEKADPNRISQYLEELTKIDDPIGTDGELLIGRYLEETLKSFGYTVEDQNFHEGFLNEDYIDLPGVNILAERGADSENRNRDILILCAHYDSKSNPREGEPLANDKSGAAALLEVARLTMNLKTDLDVCFLFVSGEEDGGYGSSHFVKKLGEAFRDHICAVICLGPIGMDNDAEYLLGVSNADNRLFSDDSVSGVSLAQKDVLNAPAWILRELSWYDQAQYVLDFGDNTATGQHGTGASEAGEDGVGGPAAAQLSVWDDMVGAPEGQLSDPWRLVTMESGIGKVFMDNSFPAVTLFQSVDGGPVWKDADKNGASSSEAGQEPGEAVSEKETDETRDPAASQGPGEAVTEQETEGVQETENQPLRVNPYRLAEVANVIAEAAALYMQSNSATLQ